MAVEFNFKSQRATTIEQSERLIALGIKKETADMTHHYLHSTDSYELKDVEFSRIMHLQEVVNKKPVLGRNGDDLYAKDVPAWSLHRLIEIALCDVEMNIFISRRCFWINKPHLSPTRSDLEGGVFDGMIDYIEWLIKEGYFPKEYLEE